MIGAAAEEFGEEEARESLGGDGAVVRVREEAVAGEA